MASVCQKASSPQDTHREEQEEEAASDQRLGKTSLSN